MAKRFTHPSILQKTEEVVSKEGTVIGKVFIERPRSALQRFPIIFTLLGAFGLVATFYGFEKVMDKTGLAENPPLLLAVGIFLLVLTGSLYQRLGG